MHMFPLHLATPRDNQVLGVGVEFQPLHGSSPNGYQLCPYVCFHRCCSIQEIVGEDKSRIQGV